MNKTLLIIILNFLFLFIMNCDFMSCGCDQNSYSYVSQSANLCTINADGRKLVELNYNNYTNFVFIVNDDTELIILDEELLQIIDLGSLKLKREIELNFKAIRAAEISKDEKYIIISTAVDHYYEDLFLLNLIDFSYKNITNTPKLFDQHPSFSHNSEKIIYTSFPMWSDQDRSTHSMSIYNIINSSYKTVMTKPKREDLGHSMEHFISPKFGIEDTTIYYIKHQLSKGIYDTLFTCSENGRNNKPLAGNLYYLSGMKISNNCKTIICVDNNHPKQLLSIDTKTLNVNKIAEFSQFPYEFSISKDGTKISYTTQTTQNYLDGEQVEQFFEYKLWIFDSIENTRIHPARGKNPNFSINGSKIVFYKIEYSSS